MILKTLTNGMVKENPVFRLMLGTCPTLAVTTAAASGLGMGVAATAVLVSSNILISLLSPIIPSKVRIPAYVTIIAGLVSVVQLLVQAFVPGLYESLGIFLPLIVVNCIILARAEAFASKNNVLLSALDGVGMGVGFTAALVLMGSVRELLGAGTVFGASVTAGFMPPILIFALPPGGFFVFGVLTALVNRLSSKSPPREKACAACPSAGLCGAADCEKPEESEA